MKNLVTFTKGGGSEKKFNISGSNTNKRSSLKLKRGDSCSNSSKDPFIDDIGVSLQAFCFDYTEFKSTDTQKVVHDCNSNNVTTTTTATTTTQQQGKPKLRRLRSWNKEFTKKLRELEENLPKADDLIDSLREQVKQSHIQTTSKQYHHKRTQSLALPETHTSDEDVFAEQQTNKKTASRRRRISSEFRHRITDNFTPATTGRRKISTPGPLRKLSTPGPLRKLSTPSLQRKNSINPPRREPDFIDYGACFSPDEMKTFNQVLDKLTTSIRNTNNTAHRRCSNISDTISHSLKEPAKKYLSTHSLKRRRKSHEFTAKKNGDLESVDGDTSSLDGIDSKSDSGCSAVDVSLTRERLDKTAEELDDLSFSRNIWYYGEFDISYSQNTKNNDLNEQEDFIHPNTGTIIARVDCCGDVVYSLTYTIEDELIPSSFPCHNNRFCLDFTDPTQPRFTSVKYLIAFLIQQNLMERVTFSWLIDNCQNFC